MSAAHLHLALNHAPLFAELFGIILLAAAYLLKNETASTLGLIALAAAGAIAVPVFFSGRAAAEKIGRVEGVAQDAIAPHEEAAEGFLWAVGLTASGAAASLAVPRRRSLRVVTLILALVSFVLVTRVALLGGLIHHPELRTAVRRSTD